jgi:hypothetical protein
MRKLPTLPSGYTLKYGEVDGFELFLDLYVSPLQEGIGAVRPRPLAMWLHGGGYLGGSRIDLPPALLMGLQQRGYLVLSPDWLMSVRSPRKSFDKSKTKLWTFVVQRLPAVLQLLGMKEALGDLYLVAQSAAAHFTLISVITSSPKDFQVPFHPPWDMRRINDHELISRALIIPVQTDVREVHEPYRDLFRRLMEEQRILPWLEYGVEQLDGNWSLPNPDEHLWDLNPLEAVAAQTFRAV